MENCPICVKPLHKPFRVYDERGKVILGCIAKCHDEHLITPSESYSWVIKQRKEFRKAGYNVNGLYPVKKVK